MKRRGELDECGRRVQISGIRYLSRGDVTYNWMVRANTVL